MSSVVLAFTLRDYALDTRTKYEYDKHDHVISPDMMQDLADQSGYQCVAEKSQKSSQSQKSMTSKSSKSGRKGPSGRMVWRKKKTPNIIQRNKSQKYSKILPSSPKSIFGSTSTERNEVRESAIPGPGAYAEDWTNSSVTSPKVKSPRMSSTFGSAKKVIAAECTKTSNLGPGCYDFTDSCGSPRRKVNGLGSTWGKAPRPVVDTVDMEMKKTMQMEATETAVIGSLEDSQFDWKWYRTQYHEMVMVKKETARSPLKSTIISNKFVPVAQSPTYNKSTHHFGSSPRFIDATTDPACLSSFHGCRPTSVKQILS